ncbi:MAG: hypothetical protein V5A62_03815 [Haloarculaceae archaeon]
MATVTRDRAQLILVGGLVVAVGLVGIAIVLNSGIYTHNLASRVDPTASDAVGHTAVVRDSVGGLIEWGVRNHPGNKSAQVRNVSMGVSNVSDLHARGSAGHGVLTNATVATTFNGTTVNQTGDRDFTDNATNADWEVADDAHGIRHFRMEVEGSSLNDSSVPLYPGVFNVTFDPNSGSDLTVSLYEDGGTTALMVTDEGTGRSFGPCTDTDTRTEIDLTGATVAGEHCAALERLGDLSRPFDVEFDDAGNVSGSYSLVVNTTSVGNVASAGDSGPSELDTLYSVEVDLQFQSQRVDYRTTITVAPGEPDG